MGFFNAIKKIFFPSRAHSEKHIEPDRTRKRREKRTVRPNKRKKEAYMSEQSSSHDEDFDGDFDSFSDSREIMTPEIINSFNEFSQLLHNMNIKMAAQNDQNRALLRSLETLPAIIKDIPRTRELEGDILQEILDLMRSAGKEKTEIAERLTDVKSAMIAMEENAKSQISFFEGKERAHRDQMNMMREFLERERKHHRNNLIVVSLAVILFIAILCGGAYVFIWERFNTLNLKHSYITRPPVESTSHSRAHSGARVSEQKETDTGTASSPSVPEEEETEKKTDENTDTSGNSGESPADTEKEDVSESGKKEGLNTTENTTDIPFE